ncbi:MAG TPA: hypothetical protein VGA50_18995, partial [Kiloniellales bacterium]
QLFVCVVASRLTRNPVCELERLGSPAAGSGIEVAVGLRLDGHQDRPYAARSLEIGTGARQGHGKPKP